MTGHGAWSCSFQLILTNDSWFYFGYWVSAEFGLTSIHALRLLFSRSLNQPICLASHWAALLLPGPYRWVRERTKPSQLWRIQTQYILSLFGAASIERWQPLLPRSLLSRGHLSYLSTLLLTCLLLSAEVKLLRL